MQFGEESMTLCANITDLISMENKAKKALSEVLSANPIYRIRDLAINGQDVQTLGYRGAEIGEALECALLAVIDGICENAHDELLEYLKNK
jgi:tRNA nucleotidyltransferase (CCA-adding enzyme)